MINVIVIGSGNVAHHIIKAFLNTENVRLIQAFSRKKENLSNLLPEEKIVTSLENLVEADVYIISVSDDAIVDVTRQLPFKDRLVVHTSGSIAMEEMNSNNRKGVFYPLQTFSKKRELDFSSIPVCIEAEQDTDFKTLQTLASSVSKHVFPISSEQRKSLHLSAVFVCNFVNHLYKLGEDICKQYNLPFDVLKPLIKETANKITKLPPPQAQTGPAVRNDLETIKKHLDFITNQNQKEIYTLLTQSIQNSNA